MVFQEHRLFPWLTVEQNVDFALTGMDKETRARLVKEHLELVGLSGFEKSYPRQPLRRYGAESGHCQGSCQ